MTVRDGIWQVLAVGWLLFVWGGLTAAAGPEGSPFDWLPFLGFPGFDKVVHFGLFFLTGFFLGRLFLVGRAPSPKSSWRRALWALGLGVLFGAATELAQVPIPGRDGSWMDVLADGAGSGAWWWAMARRGWAA